VSTSRLAKLNVERVSGFAKAGGTDVHGSLHVVGRATLETIYNLSCTSDTHVTATNLCELFISHFKHWEAHVLNWSDCVDRTQNDFNLPCSFYSLPGCTSCFLNFEQRTMFSKDKTRYVSDSLWEYLRQR